MPRPDYRSAAAIESSHPCGPAGRWIMVGDLVWTPHEGTFEVVKLSATQVWRWLDDDAKPIDVDTIERHWSA